MTECNEECIYWPYITRVSSEFGSAAEKYISFCLTAFGAQGERWDIESYVWEYEIYFKYETDYLLFVLKWK